MSKSPLVSFSMDWPCCLYIVYIETVIYISACVLNNV